MAERIDTPFTNEHFVSYCQKMVGHPYWYGTCGYKATNDLYKRKKKQNPSHYGPERTERYQKHIAANEVVCDCIGGAKGYAWTGGGQAMIDGIGKPGEIPRKYQSNGCPDKNANGMFAYAKSKKLKWGTIDTLPEVPGLALTKDGHAGYYIGEGKAVEWQGFDYGCTITEVAKRPWTHWYELPFIDYGEAVKADDEADAPSSPSPKHVIATGNVNIRVGNGTGFKKIKVAKTGSKYDWIATSENGWHAVVVGDQVGWMSGTYSKVE